MIKIQGIPAVRNYLAKIKSYDKADKKIELSYYISCNNNNKTINEPSKNNELTKINLSRPNALEKKQEINNHLQKDFKQRGFAREL